MRELLFWLVRLTGLPFLLRELLQRRCVSILCYHDPNPVTLNVHLRELRRVYRFISLERYLDGRTRPESFLPRKSLVLTFDDGHLGNYLLKDVLARHSARATIFLCSEIVGTNRNYWWKALPAAESARLKHVSDAERRQVLAHAGFDETAEYAGRQALSAAEIAELKPHVDFQSHTRFHPVLPVCSDERAAEEIRTSKAELTQRHGLSIYALAYPNGDYSGRETELARRAGYRCALTVDGGYNTRTTDAFRLRRIPIPDSAGPNELIVKASGLRWPLQHRRIGMPKRWPETTPGVTAASDTLPLVSVVLPTHNRASLLERALRSVLEQTHTQLEVLVIDDGSTDETPELMKRFDDPRIRYLRHARARGGSAARNTGVHAARGAYVAFLDDDDRWKPDKLGRQLAEIDGYDAVICGFTLDAGAGEIAGSQADGARTLVSPARLRHGYVGWGTSTLMLARRVLEHIHFDETLVRGQDWDLLIRIVERYRVLYLDEPLAVIDIGEHARISAPVVKMSNVQIEARMGVLYKHREFLGPFWFRYHAAGLRLYRLRSHEDTWRRLLRVIREFGPIPVFYRFINLQLSRPGRYR